MNTLILLTAITLSATTQPHEDVGHGIRISWKNDILTIHSDKLPGGKVEILYLEAFCRRGSTNRDWNQTIIPFKTELTAADRNGRWLKLKTLIDGKVEVGHEIRVGSDEVDFRLKFVNKTDKLVELEWLQPCMRVGAFTGRGQDDYFEKCFIFTDQGLTRMHRTLRQSEARYTPGQVYVPAGIDLNDVNPRPVSKTKPVNGLVGCFSADEKWILAAAWDHVQELFQGIFACIHNDPHIGGLNAGETKHLHGKVYLLPNNVDKLLKRYRRDFPETK